MNFIPRAHKFQLLTIFLVYLVCATVFGLAHRYAVNPDGIAQLRLASYIAEGHFMRSVTQSWSPLFIWLMSPFLFLGFDGLTTARITIALSGALLLFSSWLFLQRFELPKKLILIVLLISALLISDWSIRNIGADLPFTTLLILYMFLATHPDIFNKKKISFFCGIAGGFSYLAHHYAFPFFIIHFPVTLILRGYFNRFNQKNFLKSFALGILGFTMISSIWIGTVSIKYGHLTFSNKGKIAHAAVGPKGTGHPFFKGGLYKPRDQYAIHVFEDPSEVKFRTWSPFESREYFFHQLGLFKMNINYIFNHFIRSSPFFTYPFIVGTLSIIPIILLTVPFNKERKFLYSWVIITFLVYCSGFILIIARSPRRFYVLMLIMVIFCFSVFEELIKVINEKFIKESRSKWKERLLIMYLLFIIIPAFTLKPTIHLLKSFKDIITLEYVNPYKDIAEQINRVDFPSPVAFIRSSQKGYTDLYLAYFLNKQLLGRPRAKDIEGITRELKTVGGKTILIFDNLDIVEKFKIDNRYVHIATVKLKSDDRYWTFPNIELDQITTWDREVNIFTLKDDL
jgi:hypothetical protein